MNFITLQTEDQLKEIEASDKYSVVFKHNTTCPISKGAKSRLEQEGDQLPDEVPVYILDILSHRNISDAIAEDLDVEHESPQLLVVKNGKCVYHESLSSINAEDAAAAIDV